MEWLGVSSFSFIADVLSVLGALFAFSGWLLLKINNINNKKEIERLNESILIILRNNADGREIITPFKLRRKDMTRSEILGVIGMIPLKDHLKNQRFSHIEYLQTSDFWRDVEKVKESNVEEKIIIPCSQFEFDQFK
ncbi:MAG: hypothetical protein FJZ79_04515 [Chlorobi bacterium]|nr:hypothetical protein [Chlorobiota bacterium]